MPHCECRLAAARYRRGAGIARRAEGALVRAWRSPFACRCCSWLLLDVPYRAPRNRSSSDRFRGNTWPMRADRLVAILLLLQNRGQVTAAEVARELEISER